ncbi:MAG: class I SAM-dependent methyltransferase [Caldilineaceae bacterium]
MGNEVQQLTAAREYWDSQAAVFDNEPDHGLRDPNIRQAWTNLLVQWLPNSPTEVLDIGCGTGSLSLVLAELGHRVTGIDLSPAMLAQAEAKAQTAGQQITFQTMNGADPQFAPQQFDVVLCRHLLWALPEPAQVLQRWVKLLKPGGRLLLIEGYWHTGGGLHAQEILEMLPIPLSNITVQHLSDQPTLWGGAVTDERYAVIAARIELRI